VVSRQSKNEQRSANRQFIRAGTASRLGLSQASDIMKSRIGRLFVLAFALVSPDPAWSYDLSGKWLLEIEGPSHKVGASLVVEFTDERAASCMSGNWMRVVVVSAVAKDAHFYPVSDPLSYEIDNGRLTIGRNGICDAYLMLSGALSGERIRGEYYRFGPGGSTPLGAFTLSRKK
jgi:hypothetical protein